jgi:AraC-like DNA-binding protein
MRMIKLAPSPALAPFVRQFSVVETSEEVTRTLIPETGVVIGLRYRGSAHLLDEPSPRRLPDATLTGLRNTSRRISTSAAGGLVLVMFAEAGAAQFLGNPLDEIFGATLALDDLVPREEVARVIQRVSCANTDSERVAAVEQFLLARRSARTPDPLVDAAVRALRASRGSARIGALAAMLGISQDRLEKRFRRAVGTTPKQLASLIRLRRAVDSYRPGASLSELSIESGYFDQSHFIRDFRSVTGQAPQQFLRANSHRWDQPSRTGEPISSVTSAQEPRSASG